MVVADGCGSFAETLRHQKNTAANECIHNVILKKDRVYTQFRFLPSVWGVLSKPYVH